MVPRPEGEESEAIQTLFEPFILRYVKKLPRICLNSWSFFYTLRKKCAELLEKEKRNDEKRKIYSHVFAAPCLRSPVLLMQN